jgi:sporulation protein YlmC with PRC-barrel domain
MLISDLYGKQIITNAGKKIGLVEDVILDFDAKVVSSLLLTKVDNLIRSSNTAAMLAKNSVRFDRVKNISETIIVSSEIIKK